MTDSLCRKRKLADFFIPCVKPQAEEIIADKQAGFRARRSITEQIFNLRILCGKYLQHQQNLYVSSMISIKPSTGYGKQPYRPYGISSSHHLSALGQGYKCSLDEQLHRRTVQNNSWSKTRMSSVTHPLQNLSCTDYD